MAEYTRKFNEQEGKELSKDEFRYVKVTQRTRMRLDDLESFGVNEVCLESLCLRVTVCLFASGCGGGALWARG